MNYVTFYRAVGDCDCSLEQSRLSYRALVGSLHVGGMMMIMMMMMRQGTDAIHSRFYAIECPIREALPALPAARQSGLCKRYMYLQEVG